MTFRNVYLSLYSNLKLYTMNKTKNKSQNNLLLFAVLWLITYGTCLWLIKKESPEETTGIILALLPVFAFALFIFQLFKAVLSMDEVQIRVQMEAGVLAFSLSLLMVMTLGLLDLVISLNQEDWSFRHLVPYFVIFYFAGLIVSNRKYNLNNEKYD